MQNKIKVIIFDWGRTLHDPATNALFEGVAELIPQLSKKYKLILVSLAKSDSPEGRVKVIENSGIAQYFEKILVGGEDKNQMYEQVFLDLNVSLEQIAIVDDRAVKGIAWGNRKGATTIWFKNGKFADELPSEDTGDPMYTITSTEELKTFFALRWHKDIHIKRFQVSGIISNMSQSYYVLQNHDEILDGEGKQYHLRIRDLPQDEKPREKLLKHGLEALSVSELLSVVLSNGTKKEGVLEMCSRILKDYGDGGIMREKSPKVLSESLGIPLVKAMQIIACAELGRRFFERDTLSKPTVRTAREVFDYVKDMHNLKKEHLRGIYLNAHYKVIHDEVISIGTVDANIIHPREVFKPAIEHSAVALILVHNHPSGMTHPSDADVAVTYQLIETGKLLGVDLIDHVIVTRNTFASIPVPYRL